jgi:hypothetical protein
MAATTTSTSAKPTISGVQLRGSLCALRAPNKTGSAGAAFSIDSFGSLIAGPFYQREQAGARTPFQWLAALHRYPFLQLR